VEQKVGATYIEEIRQLHIDISNTSTPRDYVGTIGDHGPEYPESEYMRSLQMKYFPTSTWNIEEKPIFNSNKLAAWVVTGKLVWDYAYIGHPEIERSGMMAAAHTVQYKKNTDILLDLGNDVKSANTDTWKKALNFYLNFCDDIYRWETPELSENQKTEMLELAEGLKSKERREQVINTVKGDSYLLNKKNFNKWLSKIQYEIEKGL
jgi:hypothetical protein